LAHITGGGFLENIPRVLPKGCRAVIRKGSWPVLPVFQYMQRAGKIDEATMHRTFNMGIGMVIVLPKTQADKALRILRAKHEPAYVLGEIAKGKQDVKLV